ncbi:beta-caryophyllene synthase-like [Papaver somniferum]|uniref:beta-caryophyllene synthase-like n=1 Tax=Papaver somniferum TaxID=3469 RepID=UPI000E6F67B2|nr:beta-caryophyllene synthase-like [Papaver somniferum]
MSYTINFPLPTSSSSSPPPSTFTPSSTLLPISTKHLAQLEASEHFQYQPTIWDYKHFVESPKNNYSVIIEFIYICQHLFMSMYANYLFVSVFMYIQCKTDAELLMEKEKQVNLVRVTLKEAEKPLAKLELIDVIQSLGTSYIFEEDIHKILENRFRLLRQYGFHESQNIYDEFRHAIGGFKESITNDIKGMLSLFEEAWWNNLGVTKKLNFTRDRIVECFLSNVGFCWEPKYARYIEWLTKILSFALVIDDIYDVYGSLD